MHHFYKITRANAQEERGANLADLLAGLSLDYTPSLPATAEQGQADPRWIAIIARKVKGVAAHREIARRHGAPSHLPSRTPAAANDDTPAEPVAAVIPVPELVTKLSHRRQRKSGLRQREDAQKMRGLAEAVKREAVEHPAPTSLPSLTASNDNGKRRARGLASWDDAGELPQLIAVNDGLADFGTPWAWSLNIHPDLIRAGNDNARGILDFLRRRVVLNLKRSLGRAVPMWLAIETDDEGRPHLHGGLALNDNDNRDDVRACLERAGGAWSRQGSAPVDIRLQWRPIGWAAYPLKRVARTRRDLRKSVGLDADAPVTVWSCSNDLRAAGKAIHAGLRRLYNVTKSQPEETMADKFLDALDALKDAFTNGDELDAALEEIAAEHGVTPVALRNRATLAWGDLTAFRDKCAAGAAHAAKVKAAAERYTRYKYLRAKQDKGHKLTEQECEFMLDQFMNNIKADEDTKLVNQR